MVIDEAAFSRKEQEHVEALQERLDWLRDTDNRPRPSGGYTAANGFVAGEANALAWALAYIEATAEPMALRLERQEHAMRKFASRLGNIEKMLADEEDEDDA